MATQKYANLAQSTLASGYTAGDTTITLQTGDGALFPTAGDFIVAMDDPPAFFLQCTSRAGDVLTVSATGQEGTTAVNKASGTKVTQVITAGSLDGMRNDMGSLGVYAGLPATTGHKSGDRYRTTDSRYEFVFDGALWQPFAHDFNCVLPPSGWSWDNRDGGNVSTFDNTYGHLFVHFLTLGNAHARAIFKTAPAGAYEVKFLIDADLTAGIAGGGEVGIGIGFRDGTGKLQGMFQVYSGGAAVLYVLQFATSGTNVAAAAGSSSNLGASASNWAHRKPVWVKIADDSTTNITYYYSVDGQHWVQVYQTARTTFFGSGPTQIAIIGYVSTGDANVHVYSCNG